MKLESGTWHFYSYCLPLAFSIHKMCHDYLAIYIQCQQSLFAG